MGLKGQWPARGGFWWSGLAVDRRIAAGGLADTTMQVLLPACTRPRWLSPAHVSALAWCTQPPHAASHVGFWQRVQLFSAAKASVARQRASLLSWHTGRTACPPTAWGITCAGHVLEVQNTIVLHSTTNRVHNLTTHTTHTTH
jgi:hypothetical protein